MVQVDKKLDSDPVENHKILQQRQTFLDYKIEHPSSRITDSKNPLKEKVTVEEEKVTGLKAPKCKFMELSAYERRHGKAPPEKVKTMIIDGSSVAGVDVIADEDCGNSDFSHDSDSLILTLISYGHMACNYYKLNLNKNDKV